MRAHLTDDVREVADRAGAFLRARPVEHNLILTLLRARLVDPEPGRYGWIEDAGRVRAVFFQSPLSFFGTSTRLTAPEAEALVGELARAGAVLPGFNAEASTAAAFAGAWAEATSVPVAPVEAQRLFEMRRFVEPPAVPGSIRPASLADAEVVTRFLEGFHRDTGALVPDGDRDVVARYLQSGRMWLWIDGARPACLVGAREPTEGVSRVGPVYTPPNARRRGYAAACVGAVTKLLLEEGALPILFTQLSNPTSNGVYRRLGYVPVLDITRYAFG